MNSIAGPYVQLIGTTFILQTKNLLDWLTGSVDLLAASAKILHEPNLAYGDVSKPKAGEEMTEDQLKKFEPSKDKGKDADADSSSASLPPLPPSYPPLEAAR